MAVGAMYFWVTTVACNFYSSGGARSLLIVAMALSSKECTILKKGAAGSCLGFHLGCEGLPTRRALPPIFVEKMKVM